ncbi:phage tail tape measure protein [Streptomyces lydicus]|uniref:phage tail tape measure protein n=1 Tax=Streptomyces lydicus TaxID=47763 RepID=UPI001010F25B|nr:phage tail tape measure protein [Streptomyces lydicus]MCZ1006326.1 phage tail tape measure protein [Streptomyces lydicus]
MGALPPVFIEFLGHSKGVKTAMADVKAEMAAADASGAGAFRKTGMLGKAAIAGIGIAAAAVAVHTVKMAGDFQVQMTRVRTGAGEAAGNMKMVGQGVLAMAGQVGQSTEELTSGLYMVESAGYHGADALKVLRASAMGAKVGAADLKTTTDAVTTAMNAYKTGAGSATEVTNALIATEAEGKTNLEALAGSMSSILPVSAAAHVKLNEVLGAMATMTAQGTPAAVAATYLRQTIGQLSNPSGKAAREMTDLGLSAVKVGQNLGKRGLASTLTMLTDAIQHKMGPAGTVLISHLQKAAHNTTAFQKELANLSPSQQTYVGALATMVGGTKSMQAALQLTGPHMADFKRNTEGIEEHVKAGGKSIEGWADVQKNFNQKMAEAKASVQSLGIQIGQQLMPVAQKIIGVVATATSWIAKHSGAAKVAAIIIGGVLVFAIAALTAGLYSMAAAAAVNPVTWIIVGVMALVAAIIYLATHWKQVWGVIKAVAAAVGHAVVAAWNWVADGTKSIWHSITSGISAAWHGIGAFFASAWRTVTAPIVAGWNWLKSITSSVWNGIKAFFMKWWPLLLAIFAPPIALVISIWNHFHTQITNTAKTVWNGIKAFFVAIWNGIKAAAGAVWGVIKTVIVNPMKAAWKSLMSVWTTIKGWLTQQWNLIKATAAFIWSGIKAGMINPIVSAWHTISGTISSIASTISRGLHNAWNAVKNIGSSFLSIGRNIVMGIVHGVTGAAGSLFSSLQNLAEGALNSAKSFLGIHSPSRKFAEIGAYINAGLVQGLTGSAARVRSASIRIANMLYRQFGSRSHQGLQNLVARDGRALNRLAAQRVSIASRLKAAHKRLADLQKDWKKTRDDVAKSVMENVSVVTALPEGSVQLTSQDVVANMRTQVAKARKFAAELQTLRKKGLSTELVQQIASAGVDQGGATAAALATANRSQIATINKLQKSAKSAAGSVGSAVADSMYKSGIDSAKGLIKGLQSQQKAIDKQMVRIANSMKTAIRRSLGIHSPSTVMAELGNYTAQGMAQGIESGTHHAVTAAAAMAGAVAGAAMPQVPRLPARSWNPAADGQGGDQLVEVTTVVQLDRDVLLRQVQRGTLQHRRRNLTNGLDLARG